MLAKYLTQVESLIDDASNALWSTASLTNYINQARGRIAAKGQCVKVLPPGTNGIASYTVSAGGANYNTGVNSVIITGPGSGATASVTLAGGAISAVNVLTAGTGYDNTTTVTIKNTATGAGAVVVPVINCLNTVNGQEIYTFAAANSFASLTSGVASILFVESVAVSWGALKPTLQQWNWNDLQAQIRAYPIISGQPCFWAQFGQGVLGSIYIQPVPTQAASMEWSCICLPIDLVDDTTAEAIPYPWTDCVQYYSAYLAFMNARRPEEAANMKEIYKMGMLDARGDAEPSYVPDYYDF